MKFIGDYVEECIDEGKPVLLVPGHYFVGWRQIVTSPLWIAFCEVRAAGWNLWHGHKIKRSPRSREEHA